ncbi:hypothetical protein KA050_00165 [Candidatus Gracilibacteria bacterium]|nr:hypothetical protein [Candidatus Gracilibacteria bacterium]
MSSIQIAALIYFTLVVIGAWIFFGVIFLQLKRFLNLSPYVPVVSRVLTILLIALSVLGYLIIFIPSIFGALTTDSASSSPSSKPSGYFDTY